MSLRHVPFLLLGLGTLLCMEARAANGAGAALRGTVVDAIRGVPLRNAQVLIASLDGKTEREIMTGASGNFVFEDLPAGRYFVLVNHYSNASAGSDAMLRARVIVSLDAGRIVEGLRLSPPPSYTISGTVRNHEDDWPLADAAVEALSAQYVGGTRTFVVRGHSVTDDLGKFRVRNLPAGSYYLRISRAPLPPVAMAADSKRTVQPRRMFEMVYYPGVRSAAQASAIHLAPGAPSAELNVTLREVDPASVRGQVCVVPGLLPRTVHVGLYQPDAPSQEVGALAKFPVNAAGEFFIEAIPPGNHLLCGSSGEMPPAMADCTTVDIQEKGQATVKLCPRQAGSVTGRVRLPEGASGNGPPDRIEIYLTAQEGGPMAFGSGGTYPVRAGGNFAAAGLVPGRYHVSTSRLPAPWYVASIQAAGSDVTATGIHVPAGAPIQVDVVVASGGGVVEGHLKADAIPANAQVVLIPAPSLHRNPLRFYTAEVGDDGRFLIDGVAPGAYTAVAATGLAPQEYFDPEWIALYAARGTAATVAGGQSARIEIAMATW